MKTILLIFIFFTSICSQILSDYHFFNKHWYASTLEPMSWVKANEFANRQIYFDTSSHQAFYGHLVTITSAQEQLFVSSTYVNKQWTHAWLGGYRTYSDSMNLSNGWTWITGETWSYTNWAIGQPEKVSEKCLSMMNYTNGKWHDYVDTIVFESGLRYTIVEFECLISSISQNEKKEVNSIVLNKDFVKIELLEKCKSIRIIDLKSKNICRLSPSNCIYWDFRDASGRRVAAGSYFIVLEYSKFRTINIKIF